MNPKLTDEAVALLPLAAGRAELLEEIMTTAVTDHPDNTDNSGHAEYLATRTPPARRPSRWLVPVAAAAAVAGIAVASLWASGLLPQDEETSFAAPLDLPQGQGIVLDAPGWTVESLGSDGIQFTKGKGSLEVTSYPADSYDSYVEDRRHIVDPPADGAPVEVLGRPAQMWAYTADDHTAIREVEDGHWIEVRAAGMDEAGYLDLLSRLRFTSEAEFEASLPEGYVTEDERVRAAARIVRDIEVRSGAGFPGTAPTFAEGESQDRYQFGAEVAGAYACAWLEAFENARTHQQPAAAAEALAVLGTARQWPILDEMDARGDYSEVLWQIADEARAGELQPWYREGLGC